jgi:hypothetical protein
MILADKAVGPGQQSDNLNAVVPLCSNFDYDALAISSVSEMYSVAVIGLI